MKKHSDHCSQLRKLHDRLVDEVRLLRESLQEEEEGFENPLEMAMKTEEISISVEESLRRAGPS